MSHKTTKEYNTTPPPPVAPLPGIPIAIYDVLEQVLYNGTARIVCPSPTDSRNERHMFAAYIHTSRWEPVPLSYALSRRARASRAMIGTRPLALYRQYGTHHLSLWLVPSEHRGSRVNCRPTVLRLVTSPVYYSVTWLIVRSLTCQCPTWVVSKRKRYSVSFACSHSLCRRPPHPQ